MKEDEQKEVENFGWKSVWRLLSIIATALFETLLVVIIASFPMMCIGLFNLLLKGDGTRLISSVSIFFTHGDGLILATSLLGTALINALDLFGDKNRIWEGVRDSIYLGVFIVYGLVLVCECAVEVPHEDGKGCLMAAWIQISFLVVAGVILLLSHCWRRRFPLRNRKNPYQDSDNAFINDFSEYVKRNMKGEANG